MNSALFQKAWGFSCEKFSQIDLNNPEQQRIFAIVLGLCMAIVLIGTVTWAAMVEMANKEEPAAYNPLRFDQYDAELICSEKMNERLGESLLRFHVDNHSSRFDHAKGIYRIYFRADVGKMDLFDEVMVYCHVNHFNYELTHYKEYNQSVNPVMSTDIKFFGG